MSTILINDLEYISINELFSKSAFKKYINKCNDCKIIKEINDFIK